MASYITLNGTSGTDIFRIDKSYNSSVLTIISDFNLTQDKISLYSFGSFGLSTEIYNQNSTKLIIDENNAVVFENVQEQRLIEADFYQSQFSIVGQSIDLLSTEPFGAEFRVNNYTLGDQSSPSLSALIDGGFVIVWSGAGSEDSDGDTRKDLRKITIKLVKSFR